MTTKPSDGRQFEYIVWLCGANDERVNGRCVKTNENKITHFVCVCLLSVCMTHSTIFWNAVELYENETLLKQ